MGGVALAGLVAALLGGAVTQFGPSLGFVDRPDGYLKSHDIPAVPLGGVAIFAAVHLAMALEGTFDLGLFIASGILFMLGLIDDRLPLSSILRLVIEAGAGLVLALTADVPAVPEGALGAVLVVVIVVVAVNAVNLMDGLDGLAGSSALVASIGIGLLAATRGLPVEFGFTLAAALGGFLIWNWPKARLFLGDNGAYTVAAFLSYGFLNASPEASELQILAAAGLLGVFAVDLAVTLTRRRISGRPLFEGDRSHVYDQLHDRGMPVAKVALTFAAAEAGIVALVIAVDWLTPPLLAVALLAAALVGFVLGLGRAGFLQPAG